MEVIYELYRYIPFIILKIRQQFTIELANQGINVLGIGQEPYDQLINS